jgi:hypothetical protein
MIAAPAPSSRRIFDWQSSTLAERVADLVNAPATQDPGSRTASITSVLPAYLTPAAAVANLAPLMTGSVGKLAGAKGETDVILATI